METIVVSIFLPLTIDFHEFEYAEIRKQGDEIRRKQDLEAEERVRAEKGNRSTDNGKHDSLSDFFRGEGGEEPLSPRSTPRPPPAAAAASSAAVNADIDTGNTGNDTETGTGPATRTISAGDVKDLLFPDARYRHGAPKRLPGDGRTAKWILTGTVTPPAERMDSVLATSVSEDNLKSLSSTDLKSQAKTANLKVHNNKHNRKGSFRHVPPKVPDPEVSTFDDHKWTVCEPVLTNAALVNALTESPEGKKQMPHTLWIGTLSRVESDRITKDRKDEISLKFEQDHNCSIMYIGDKDFQLFYEHFCKLVLWPVLNYRMPDYPKSQIYQETSWVHFERINHAFADKIISRYKSGDVIWIHDYHLMAVPGFIRDKFPDAKIGFFMHTSFPSPEVFRCVPAHAELLRGMLGANVVIFQTQEYADHFLLCCNRFLCVDNYKDGVYFKGRFVNVAVEPMRFTHERIDAEITKRYSRVEDLVETITDVTKDRYLIFSRDKLDNIRGIRHKLLSFEMFLERNPSMKSKATFIQFATSTTELVEIQASVLDVVNRINRRYNTGDIPSVSVLLQDIPLDHYIALLAHGDIMMVTTLREGMGLTPQEFIYCQDGSLNPQKKHGVLILSENTGTSQLLQGSDLTCNPYDIPGNAKLIEKAYLMSPHEKETRYNKMRSSILKSSGGKWLLEINHKLDAAYAEQSARYHFRLPRLNTDSLTKSYSSATTKLFILDNEDTLSTFPPSGLNYDDLCNTLTVLTTSPHNTVYITSSLEPGTLASFYRKIPSLGLIAADGSYVRHPYSPPDQWEAAETTQTVSKWKSDIEQVLTYHLSRVEGAFAIEDMCRIIVDYTDAKHPVSARLNITELCSFVNTICPGLGIRATYNIESPDHNSDGKEHTPKKQLIIGTFQTNKLSAIEKICADDAWEKCPYDWILVAGDGREDEPVMEWANQLEEDERDLAERRYKASKAAEADLASQRAAREASELSSKRREKMHATGPGASFTLGDDDDDDDGSPHQFGKMRPLGDRTKSTDDVVKSYQAKPRDSKPALKVWTISLGPTNTETHARHTLAGGPMATQAMLKKLAAAEQAASAHGVSETAGSVDRRDPGGGHRKPPGNKDNDSDDSSETDLSKRPFAFAYDYGLGDLGYELKGKQAQPGSSQQKQANKGDYDGQDVTPETGEVQQIPVEYEPASGAALANAYFERGGIPTPAEQPATTTEEPTTSITEGKATETTAELATSTTGEQSSDNIEDDDRANDSPPDSMIISPRSHASVSTDTLRPSTRSPSDYSGSTAANSVDAGFSSRAPSPAPPSIPDIPMGPPPPPAPAPAPAADPNFPFGVPPVATIIDPHRHTHVHWSNRAPALPVPISGEALDRIFENDPNIVASSSRRDVSSPARSISGRSARSDISVASSVLSPPESEVAENPNVRDGRDFGDIVNALEKVHTNSYALHEGDRMYGADFPCLDSDNESEGTYRRNRKRELEQVAEKKRDRDARLARKAKKHGVSIETILARLNKGKKVVDHTKDGFHNLSSIEEEPTIDAALGSKPEYTVDAVSSLRRIGTVQDMTSLLYSGRHSDHYRTSSLVPLKARISTGAKLSIISSYESKEKLKKSLPRSQSTPYLPSTLKSVHHAGATKGAIPSPHSGLVTNKSLNIALAQAPPIIDEEFDLINENEHHYRKLIGKVIDDSADEYTGTEDLYNRFRANEAEQKWADHVKEREEKRERFEKERRERQYAMLKGNMGLHGQCAGKGKGKEKKRLTREEILQSEESDGEDGIWF